MSAPAETTAKRRVSSKRTTTTTLKTEKKAPPTLASAAAAASTTTADADTAATPSPLASSPSSPANTKQLKPKKSVSATRESSVKSTSTSSPVHQAVPQQPHTSEQQDPQHAQQLASSGAEVETEEPRRSLPPEDDMDGDDSSSDGLDGTRSSSVAQSSQDGSNAEASARRAPEQVTSLAGKRHTKVVMQPPSAAYSGSGGNTFVGLSAGAINARQTGGLYGVSGRRGGGAGTTNATNTTAATAGNGNYSAGGHHHGDSTLRYRTDLDKPVIHFMFERYHQEQVCPSASTPAAPNADAADGSGAVAAAAAAPAGSTEETTAPRSPPPPSTTVPQSRARRIGVEEIYVPANGEGEDKNIGLGDWHCFWMHVGRVRHTICSSDFRWQDQQIINHFPDHAELTRKDLMYKNIKRYLRENQANNYARLTLHTATDWVSAAANAAPAGGGENNSQAPLCTKSFCFADSVPITYNIPNDMSMFKEECQKQRGTQWIVKPTSRSQGKGIFIIDDVRALQRWVREKKETENAASFLATGPSKRATWVAPSVLQQQQQQRAAQQSQLESGTHSPGSPTSPTPSTTPPPGAASSTAVNGAGGGAGPVTSPTTTTTTAGGLGGYIVSRYISNPLLIGGKKFDLRLYVLVTSYKPLVAYLHEDGFARFCATRYNARSLAQEDLGSHLTNVALQKGDEHYNTSHGGKWSFQNLFLYVQARYGPYAAEGMMTNIQFLIYHSLKAVGAVMFNDKHSFELYGYDILIDEQINPHLIEVNASPSMSTTTVSDRLLKEQVLTDAMKIIFPPGFPTNNKAMPYWEYRQRTDLTTQHSTGFKLLQFP